MRICVLIVDDVFDTGLASILDTFEIANELGGENRFDVCIASPRGRVKTHLGFTVPVEDVPSRADLVIVPALASKSPHSILAALEKPDVVALIETVQKFSRKTRVAAACTGTFVLGSAGVLNGRRATTSWWLGPTFRQAFPEVELVDDEMIVSDEGCVTAGAALAHVDLALAVIREKSPDLAATVAHFLLMDDRTSQAPYVVPSHVAHDDEVVKKFERWVRGRLKEPFELAKAARAVGASERTLQRRVRAVLGKPPIGFVQDLRLERAVHLLRASKDSVDDIASSVGYEDGSTLRALLRRKLHTGVRELR
jgi:transcriptional regulator GlxA family with amidase domain